MTHLGADAHQGVDRCHVVPDVQPLDKGGACEGLGCVGSATSAMCNTAARSLGAALHWPGEDMHQRQQALLGIHLSPAIDWAQRRPQIPL